MWQLSKVRILRKKIAEIEVQKVDYPVFVKPANMGSSVVLEDISKAEDFAWLTCSSRLSIWTEKSP